MELIKPHPRYEASYQGYIQELGDEERYPFTMDFDHEDFPALLEKLTQYEQGINLPEGRVPSSTFWLVEGDELVGVANLRHTLNDEIREIGGHIGLGIRPSYRGKGLSKLLLNLTLEQAQKRGIVSVLIHCYQHNLASGRMIEACGGVLESEVTLPNDDSTQKDFSNPLIVQRFIVSLPEQQKS